MAARASGTPFGNTGSCAFLGAVDVLVEEVESRRCGGIYLNPIHPSRDVRHRSCT